VGAEGLERRSEGWGNAFWLPSPSDRPVVISFARPLGQYLWMAGLAFLWLVTLGAATARRRPTARPRA
jgi:hypothetical protein